jgi:hypothetical protein
MIAVRAVRTLRRDVGGLGCPHTRARADGYHARTIPIPPGDHVKHFVRLYDPVASSTRFLTHRTLCGPFQIQKSTSKSEERTMARA